MFRLAQEEIRFALCPELIASRLFTEFLLDNEVLIVYGPERFSSEGTTYGQGLRYESDHQDEAKLDTETGTHPYLYSYQTFLHAPNLRRP